MIPNKSTYSPGYYLWNMSFVDLQPCLMPFKYEWSYGQIWGIRNEAARHLWCEASSYGFHPSARLRSSKTHGKENRQKVSTKGISWYFMVFHGISILFHHFPSVCPSIFPSVPRLLDPLWHVETMPPPCPDRFIVQPRWLHRERHGVPRAHRISTGGGSKTWMVMVLIWSCWWFWINDKQW